MLVVSVYFSPGDSFAWLERELAELAGWIRVRYISQILVAGDFNAKNHVWSGWCSNSRKRYLERWELDLVLLNMETEITCMATFQFLTQVGEYVTYTILLLVLKCGRVGNWNAAYEEEGRIYRRSDVDFPFSSEGVRE